MKKKTPKQKKRMPRTPSWLPKPIKLEKKKGIETVEDCFPWVVDLRRMSENDDDIRGSNQTICCDCGLEHLMDYAVTKRDNGWFLVIRTYRIEKEDKEKKKRE